MGGPIGTCLFCLASVDSKAKEEPPPSAPERVIVGSVIGYRAWRIKDWKLHGTSANRSWVPGVNEASCDPGPMDPYAAGQYFANLAVSVTMTSSSGFTISSESIRNSHPAPAPGCACGITALARFAESNSHWTGADVFGAIEAWSDEGDGEPGRFFLHRNGFRAQYGKVVLLAVDEAEPAAKNAAIRALAREHGADVCRREHLEDAAKEHGQLVPEEMLEWVDPADRPSFSSRSNYLAQLAQLSQRHAGYTTTIAATNPAWLTVLPHGQWVSNPPFSPRGISKVIVVPGPPSHGKYRKNARVLDSRGVIWLCRKGGRPGRWEREE